MSRPVGIPKTGGRQKNTPNKATTVSIDFRKRLESKKVNLEAELAKAILAGNVDLIRALTGLLPYLAPRIKEAEGIAESQTLPDETEETPESLDKLVRLLKPDEPDTHRN